MIIALRHISIRSLLCGVPFLFCGLADAQTARIDAMKRTVEIPCPEMSYFSNPKIDVSIGRDEHSDEYVYHYTMTPSRTDTQRAMFFAMRDLSGSHVKLESGFTMWQSCHYSDTRAAPTPLVSCINIPPKLPAAGGAYTGLVIRSKAPPGIVWYQIEAASVPTDWTLQSLVAELLPYYRGKAGLISEAIQEQVGEECPSGTVSKNTDRNMTGVTLGPSDTAQVDVVRANNGVDAALANANLRLAIREPSADAHGRVQTFAARLADVDLSSIHIQDSAGNPLQTSAGTMQALAKETRASFVLDLGVAESKLPCNVKGLIVDGKLNDGTPIRGGIAVNTTTCQRGATGTFHLTLPKPDDVLQYSGDESD